MGGRDHLTSPNLGGLDRFAAEPEKVEKLNEAEGSRAVENLKAILDQ